MRRAALRYGASTITTSESTIAAILTTATSLMAAPSRIDPQTVDVGLARGRHQVAITSVTKRVFDGFARLQHGAQYAGASPDSSASLSLSKRLVASQSAQQDRPWRRVATPGWRPPLQLGMIQIWKIRVGRSSDCTRRAGYRCRRSSPVRLPLRFGLYCRDCPPPNFFLVARRISSDSLRSFTALASTSAPTREAMVAIASSSRCRCLSSEPIRSLSKPIMPRTPAVNRSRTAWLWRDTSPDTAAKGQPHPGPSRCVGERYFET